MKRSVGNVEVVVVSFNSGVNSFLFQQCAAREKFKRCFILSVSMVNITLYHGKHVACNDACELQAACACNIKIHVD
jgi:hypothetical protein